MWGLVLNLDDPLVTVFALQAFGFETELGMEREDFVEMLSPRCICAAAAPADDDDGAANDGHSTISMVLACCVVIADCSSFLTRAFGSEIISVLRQAVPK